MKSTPNTMKLFGSVAVLASVAAGYFFVVSPFTEERAIAAQEMEDAEASVQRLDAELKRVTLVRDGIAEVQSIDAEVSRAFPSAAQVPQFTNEVLAAATRAGLSTDAITSVTAEVPTLVTPSIPAPTPDAAAEDPTAEVTPSDPAAVSAPSSSLAEMSISIAAVGTTEQLAAFLRELSNMERAYLISNATLAGEPGETGSLAVSGTTFLYRPVIFPTEEIATGEDTTDPIVVDENGVVEDGTVQEPPIEGTVQP